MDYTIEWERLSKVFSKFLERTFDDIRIEKRKLSELSNKYADLTDGKPEDGNYLAGVYYRDTEFWVYVPDWSRIIRPTSNTFGDMWKELLMDYFQRRLPEIPISNIIIIH